MKIKKLHLAIFAIVFAIFGLSSCQENNIKDRIHLLKKDSIPLRFKIVSQPTRMVLVGRFYDLDGNSVGQFQLPFDDDGPITLCFHDVDVSGNHILFPSSISIGENNFQNLCAYYSKNGFPMVYNSTLLDATLREEIGKIFDLINSQKEEKLEKEYGNLCTINTYVDLPQEGVSYECCIEKNGKVYFLKNN